MEKQIIQAGTWLFPLPVALVSCGTIENPNIITISWTGTLCSEPALCYISVRPERFSHALLMKNPEFVINLADNRLAKAADWCGVKSGRDFDKFKEMKLSPVKASTVACPIIAESPVNIECTVIEVKKLGSHDMFLAKVNVVQVAKDLIQENAKVPDLKMAELISYVKSAYFKQGDFIGKSGFSLK